MDHVYVDRLIIGAGIYGLYGANISAEKGYSVAVLEYDEEPFQRASYINQARVHNGYHYPRSLSTALKSSNYYNKFNDDHSYAINDKFNQIYGIAKRFSWTSEEQYEKFCSLANIPAEKIDLSKYFNVNLVQSAYLTEEYAFDAEMIKQRYYISAKNNGVNMFFRSRITEVTKYSDRYEIIINAKIKITTPYVLNASYASTNQIIRLFDKEYLNIKYEICEVILVKANKLLSGIGLTIMDGPFFSVMPFGDNTFHSLTSVNFTPHKVSTDLFPTFSCQDTNNCSPSELENCNICPGKPQTAWQNMAQLAKKYLIPSISFCYETSLFAIKPILNSSEIDDSRPTVIKTTDIAPTFISVLSGKINTIYDLDEVL